MLAEPGILGRDDGSGQVRRDLLERHPPVVYGAALGPPDRHQHRGGRRHPAIGEAGGERQSDEQPQHENDPRQHPCPAARHGSSLRAVQSAVHHVLVAVAPRPA